MRRPLAAAGRNSLTAESERSGPVEDDCRIEQMARFDRDRIPERELHGTRAGAIKC